MAWGGMPRCWERMAAWWVRWGVGILSSVRGMSGGCAKGGSRDELAKANVRPTTERAGTNFGATGLNVRSDKGKMSAI